MATDVKTLDGPVTVLDHAQGSPTAVVTLVEYGDYTSSACGDVHALVQDAQPRLGDLLRFVFRHFVTEGARPVAQHAAEAAEAAGVQGRFWDLHDSLFRHQGALDNGCIVEYADSLGLDVTRILRELSEHAHAGRVREDLESGRRSGVRGAPAFFINGVRYRDGLGTQGLVDAIEEAAAAGSRGACLPTRGDGEPC